MPTLFVLSGPQIGRSFEVSGEVLLGRSPECQVPLAAPSISRRHARLALEDGAWVVHDLDSRNGLFSGARGVERLELADGDVFRLGDVELRFRLAGAGDLAGARPVPAPAAPSAPSAPSASAPSASASSASVPPASALDVDEIVLEDDLAETQLRTGPARTPPPPSPPRPPTSPRSTSPPPSSAPDSAPAPRAPAPASPPRTGGPARRGAPTAGEVRQRDTRPALQYHRVEDRGGLLTSDLSQYPLGLRLGALLLGLALFVGIFLFAFRGTALLKGKLGGGAARAELASPD